MLTKPMSFATIALLFLVGSSTCVGQSASDSVSKQRLEAPAQSANQKKILHEKLARYLSGTKWTGNFVMDGKDKMITEYYEILSATKGETGDAWNLIARIKYGDKDMSFPLPPIDIKFAGKTPVITVDRVYFPGFGTFDARVVIRKGKYAGTWSHDKVGGHLFGTIKKMTDQELAAGKKKLTSDRRKKPSKKKEPVKDAESDKK